MRTACSIMALLTLLVFAGCKDPYYPELKPGQTNFLVVEGFISNDKNATQIRLSRTIPIKDSVGLKAETGAFVTVEGEDNSVYSLIEQEAGLYRGLQLALDPSTKYRLRIRTANGSDYASEYASIRQTPPVAVNWTREADGVHISFSSQSLPNDTRYYKWNFEETWEILSHYEASYKYRNGAIGNRDPEEVRQMKHCWGRNRPTNIRLISTVPLAKNVIEKEPAVFIPAADEKLDVRYSMLVTLQALDKKGYEFYQLMKKNTESLGSLFDPQPSDITGNISCLSNPGEKVIGYVMGSTLQEKRIFISKDEVPGWSFNPGCATIKVPNEETALKVFADDEMVPYGIEGFMPILGYYGVENRCADCRTRGNNERPSFW